MTVQISDTLLYDNRAFSITSLSDGKLFIPKDYGFNPVSFSTACWRGYFGSYEIIENILFLKNLAIGFSNLESIKTKRTGQPIFLNKTPEWDENRGYFTYKDLNLNISFTGGILLGYEYLDIYGMRSFRYFSKELNALVFLPPQIYEYEIVYEAKFEGSKLVSIDSKSTEMEKLRKKLHSSENQLSENESKEIFEWLKTCFKLNYFRHLTNS
jgi:hypothetical protein